MTEMRCDTARELIPDLAGGRLSAAEGAGVRAHLETCAECRAEAQLARLLFAGRPQVPVALASRVRTAVHAGRRPTRNPWWGVAAAAVAVLAVGIGVGSRRIKNTGTPVPGYVAEGTAPTSSWLNDDGMVAGAPALQGLSNDALQTLLEELDNSGAGAGPGSGSSRGGAV